jgi:CsoR family transcriptional regulator, copper-sensing transcriptional repressor
MSGTSRRAIASPFASTPTALKLNTGIRGR